MIQQSATWIDVTKDVIQALVTLSLPFVLVAAARWQTKKAEKVAEGVAKVAVDAAEKVATTVTDVAAKADEKVEKIHGLVNSQHQELKKINRAQALLIERLQKERRSPPRRKPRTRR